MYISVLIFVFKWKEYGIPHDHNTYVEHFIISFYIYNTGHRLPTSALVIYTLTGEEQKSFTLPCTTYAVLMQSNLPVEDFLYSSRCSAKYFEAMMLPVIEI